MSILMMLFYGFLFGLVIMFTGFSVKKQVAQQTSEMISAAGGTISVCCFLMILFLGYLSAVF